MARHPASGSYLVARLQRIFDQGTPGRALLATSDAPWAATVAPALHHVGLVPTLAFEASQVFACLDVDPFDLLIIEMELARPSPAVFLETVHSRTHAAPAWLGWTPLWREVSLIAFHRRSAGLTARSSQHDVETRGGRRALPALLATPTRLRRLRVAGLQDHRDHLSGRLGLAFCSSAHS